MLRPRADFIQLRLYRPRVCALQFHPRASRTGIGRPVGCDGLTLHLLWVANSMVTTEKEGKAIIYRAGTIRAFRCRHLMQEIDRLAPLGSGTVVLVLPPSPSLIQA